MARYLYARSYRPPAPVLPVRVRRPGAVISFLVAAIVDTGAGVSVVPEDLPVHLDLPAAGSMAVAGFDGIPRIVPVYTIELDVNGHSSVLRAISFGTTALLGRDVLNALVVSLRGPEAVMVVDAPRG